MRTLAILALVSLVSAAAFAQSGGITGTVVASHSEPVPDVRVTAVGPTRASVTALSNATGRYAIDRLAPGTYVLTFESPGFSVQHREVVVGTSRLTLEPVRLLLPCWPEPGEEDAVCMTDEERAARLAQPGPWSFGPGRSFEASTVPCEWISLFRGGGLVYMPDTSFSVMLTRGGSATIRRLDQRTKRDKLAWRRFEGKVELSEYARLCHLAERFKLADMGGGFLDIGTDAGRSRITVHMGGRDVSVVVSGGVGPIEFWALDQAIDNVRRQIEWKPVPDVKGAP